MLNLKLKDLFPYYFINVFIMISSSKLIFIFLFLSNKLSTELNIFFAYKLDAETVFI